MRTLFSDAGSTLWGLSPSAPMALEVDSGRELAALSELQGCQDLAVASAANRLFALKDQQVHCYDLFELKLQGTWPLPRWINQADRILLSADASRVVLFDSSGQQEAQVLSLEQ